MPLNPHKRIKVVRIIARLNIGGPAIHAALLTEGLNKDIFDSLLVCGSLDRSEGDMYYYAKEKNVNPIIIPQLQRRVSLFNDLIAFIKIYFLIRKERPDIIHTHTAKAGALGRLAGIMHNAVNPGRGCRLIHTFHGTVLEGYFGKIRSKFFIWVERSLAYFTDSIIVVSQAIKEELLKFKIGNPQKIAVIPLGLEMEKLLNMARSCDDTSLFRVGIVGRLVPIKNHRMFLEAAKLFLNKQKLPSGSCGFFIIGDGELREKLEAYALKLGIEGFVKFLGWMRDVPKVYSSLDVVVLTSLNEGTPVSLIEAMAAARPVIATDVGGVRDLFIKTKDYGITTNNRIRLYENGILCKNHDAQGLKEALCLFYDNPRLRQEMATCARNFVRDRFSKERLIKDIEMLYNRYLKRSGS